MIIEFIPNQNSFSGFTNPTKSDIQFFALRPLRTAFIRKLSSETLPIDKCDYLTLVTKDWCLSIYIDSYFRPALKYLMTGNPNTEPLDVYIEYRAEEKSYFISSLQSELTIEQLKSAEIDVLKDHTDCIMEVLTELPDEILQNLKGSY
jgi:hypothetical protein